MVFRAFIVLCVVGCHHDSPPPIGDSPTALACPTHLDLQLIGAESRFDPGYSGLAHGVGLSTGSNLTVETYECDPACRRCKFHGPVRPDPALEPVVPQRCLENTQTICTQDTDCGTGGHCRFVFPPIQSLLGGASTCNLAFFEPVVGAADPSPVQGVFDFETGEMDLVSLNIFTSVSLGACDECHGDSALFDGVADGHCVTAGNACDVAGVGTTIQSLTSYDCKIGATFIKLALPGTLATTASHSWKMTATDTERPRCTGTMKPCWCGMCSDGTPCTANFQCATGACNATSGPPNGSTYTIKNNSCGSGCNWNMQTQTGTCIGAPATKCFPDSGEIIAQGAAEVHDGFYIAQVANLECLPSFGSPLIDGAAGFPGPLLFQARFRVSTRVAP